MREPWKSQGVGAGAGAGLNRYRVVQPLVREPGGQSKGRYRLGHFECGSSPGERDIEQPGGLSRFR